MKRTILKKLQEKKGFTLIELIIVIAIVAVLATVGIVAVGGQTAKGHQASLDTTAKQIADAAESLFIAAEATGKTVADIGAITDAEIYSKAGVDSADFGTIVILKDPIDENGTVCVATSATSYRIASVTVPAKNGSMTGTFTRT